MADAQVRGFVQPGIDLGGALQRAYQSQSTNPMDYIGPLSMAALNVMPGGEGVEAQALGNVARTAARSERFNWPVTTSYGKTIDMPITVNPSRGDIQRELAKAPHGDVRALRHPDGSVYLWPANEAMHVDIASNFDMPFRTRSDLQKSSYLINKSDADKLGKWSNFDDLINGIDASADQPMMRDVTVRGRSGRPVAENPLPIGNEQNVLAEAARSYLYKTGARPVPLNGPVKSDPGYVYHATNTDRIREIAASGKLDTHRPGDFTDQDVWPDGSTQKRNYFTSTAQNTWQFAPEEGTPTLLRMKQDVHPLKKESTGDLYSTKPVPSERLEVMTDMGWRPIFPAR
jgi:hypothetical protein